MLAVLAGPKKFKQRSKSAVNQLHPESWATQLEIGKVTMVFSSREAKEGNRSNHTLFYQV